MATAPKIFKIDLPKEFVHEGVSFGPGTVEIESESIYNDLTEAVRRIKRKEARKAKALADQMESVHVRATSSSGVDSEELEQMVNSAVEARTASLTAKVEGLESKIAEYEDEADEDEDEVPDPNAKTNPKEGEGKLKDGKGSTDKQG